MQTWAALKRSACSERSLGKEGGSCTTAKYTQKGSLPQLENECPAPEKHFFLFLDYKKELQLSLITKK